MLKALIDFSDHRVIGLIVCLSLALVSLSAIFVRYLIHKNKKD